MNNLFDDELFNEDMAQSVIDEHIEETVCNIYTIDKFFELFKIDKYFKYNIYLMNCVNHTPYEQVKNNSILLNELKSKFNNKIVYVFQPKDSDLEFMKIYNLNLIFVDIKIETITALDISLFVKDPEFGEGETYTSIHIQEHTKDTIENAISIYKHVLKHRNKRKYIPAFYDLDTIKKSYSNMDDIELLKLIYKYRRALNHLYSNTYTFKSPKKHLTNGATVTTKFEIDVSADFESMLFVEKKFYVDTYHIK